MSAWTWYAPPAADPEAVRRRLGQFGAQLEAGPPRTLVWLDTFDDRLFAAGEAAALVGDRLERRALDGTVLAVAPIGSAPPWLADDLPADLRGPWAPLLEMRALLPRVETVRTRLAGPVHRKGKPAGQLVLEITEARQPGYPQVTPLPVRVVFEAGPKRKRADKTLRHLYRALPERDAAGAGPVSLARNSVGAPAGAYRSKLRTPLNAEARADSALKAILRQVFAVMRANEPGLLADLDSEFNHDFRVAVRRTRSALSQLGAVLPPPVLDRFGPEFRWLQGLTGPLRDLDVYLLELPAYRRRLPPELADALDPLLALIQQAQVAAHAEVVAGLTSARYRALVDGWRAWLESPVPDVAAGPKARQPVLKTARRRIAKSHARIIADGQAIGPDTPAEAVHALRKRCKKLRYLLEFFRALFPPTRMNRLIAALKGLQTHLGTFNDLEVHRDALRGFADQLAAEGTSAGTGEAVGLLVHELTARQAEVRAEFADHFARFAAPETCAAFEELFGELA